MQHLLLEPPANEEAGPGIDVPLQINLRPEGLRVVDANTEPRHGKASKSKVIEFFAAFGSPQH